ncbi:hypothetical protein [Yoonia sp.]
MRLGLHQQAQFGHGRIATTGQHDPATGDSKEDGKMLHGAPFDFLSST